jgi:hypothetical protein
MLAFIFQGSFFALMIGIVFGMSDTGLALAGVVAVCLVFYFIASYPMILIVIAVLGVGALVFHLLSSGTTFDRATNPTRMKPHPGQLSLSSGKVTSRVTTRTDPMPMKTISARRPTAPNPGAAPVSTKSRGKKNAPRIPVIRTSPLTKAELSPHAIALFSRLRERLPTNIAQRLQSNRFFVTHGSYNNFYLFDVWDRHQTDVLSRQHFKYCLGCDLRGNTAHVGAISLWLNTIRIYRNREEIVAHLSQALARLRLPGFVHEPHDRAICIVHRFDYPRDLADLPDLLLPHYVTLISAVHPILMPVIDQFKTALGPGERRAVVAKRGRIPFTHPGVHNPERVREYTRSVSPKLRAEILRKHAYRCVLCRADLRFTPAHIDHIKAFSKGGTSAPENLQPLCGPCNLAKGNRDL